VFNKRVHLLVKRTLMPSYYLQVKFISHYKAIQIPRKCN